MIKKYQNFIFDFDGTIANSNRFHRAAFKKVLLLVNINNFNYENLKGLKTEDAFKKLGIKKNIFNLSELKRKYYRKDIKKIQLYKNCKKTLTLLKNRKKKIFIVSGSSKENINYLLKKEKIGVNGIISRDNCKFSKPNKMPFKKCLDKFKLKKKETIVIEDAISGIQSAKKNNLKVIGINNIKIKNFSDYYVHNFYFFLKKFF